MKTISIYYHNHVEMASSFTGNRFDCLTNLPVMFIESKGRHRMTGISHFQWSIPVSCSARLKRQHCHPQAGPGNGKARASRERGPCAKGKKAAPPRKRGPGAKSERQAAMADMCFFPGLAASELDRMASEAKRPKSVVLRGLIDGAIVHDKAPLLAAYNGFTSIGRQMIEQSRMGKFTDIFKFVQRVERVAAKVEAPVNPICRPCGFCHLSKAGKSHMMFRPRESEPKLVALARRSGIGKAATLRALILDMALPDTLAFRTWARLMQIGALAKHIAYRAGMRNWQELEAAGYRLQAMAAPHMREEQRRRETARGLYDNRDCQTD